MTPFTRIFTLGGVISRSSFSNMDIFLKAHQISRSGRKLFPVLLQELTPRKQRIVLEFSSPNIAKPFHVGHLRSTLLGAFLSNLFRSCGHDVITINYLGDWGTQFGMLLRAVTEPGQDIDFLSCSQTSKEEKIRKLFAVYVDANQRSKADAQFYQDSLEVSRRMENGNDSTLLDLWREIRTVSLQNFDAIYDHFGTTFDHLESESQYVPKACALQRQWSQSGFLRRHQDGRFGFYRDSVENDQQGDKFVTVFRSDESTMYLGRDLAAILDRYERFQFDRIYYVVGAEQLRYFGELKEALEKFGYAGIAQKLVHVPFRKVKKMSTRDGTVLFVDEMLQMGESEVLNFLKGSPNFRIPPELVDHTKRVLATGSWQVCDFNHRRMSGYPFYWRSVLSYKGNTAVSLQYTHARLCSLIGNPNISALLEKLESMDFGGTSLCSLLAQENHFSFLVESLAGLPNALENAIADLEPYPFVAWLHDFAHVLNVLHKNVRVQDEPESVALPRLAMFVACRKIFAESLRFLGTEPLERM